MRNRREKKEKKRTSSGNPSAAGETPKFRITTLASGASDKLGVQNAVFGFSTTKHRIKICSSKQTQEGGVSPFQAQSRPIAVSYAALGYFGETVRCL